MTRQQAINVDRSSRASEGADSGGEETVTTAEKESRGSASDQFAAHSSVAITSLAPSYDENQHGTYLRRLEEVIKEPRNRNVALTGRYGAGKSSILDKFAAADARKSTTLRLAISSLGPNEEGASLTNRIQKELVKQIVYSASSSTLRRSRFRRSVAHPWWQSALEATAVILLLAPLLALLGWLPSVAGTSPDYPVTVRIGAWALLAAILITMLTVLRMVTHDRFVVTDVAAGGAAVKLSAQNLTYFDEYLDDIVNYFDAEAVDFVIFEDLDRFDDPRIFEALRELNTLLNNTKKRTRDNAPPLRFVYAVRDSLFEKLGKDTQGQGDGATAETVRANRTKFFDVVIPVVPFISHRNAQDLLAGILKKANVSRIERSLVGIVARNCADMRLLHNMCNEYLLFAERLLDGGTTAPGLSPSRLFALVAYKNFHLEDFELISRQASDLDRLYRFRRDLVRASISALEQRKRDISAGLEQVRTRVQRARELGEILRGFVEFYNKKVSPNIIDLEYDVDGQVFPIDSGLGSEFWQVAASANKLTIFGMRRGTRMEVLSLTSGELGEILPGGMDVERWSSQDDRALRSEIARIDSEISDLRRADFVDLAADSRYRLMRKKPLRKRADSGSGVEPGSSSQVAVAGDLRTFSQLTDQTLKSELARDLVKGGHIDRNFALYAAQFYGDFTGVDVANFVVQSVQSNSMDIDYSFTGPGAVANLLDEVDDDFTHTVSAFNTDIVNYLLGTRDDRADNVVRRIISDFDEDARSFISSYFTSGVEREGLAAHLALRGWRETFTYIATDEGVPDEMRPALMSAAIGAVDVTQRYNLSPETGAFIVQHYLAMPVFTTVQERVVRERVAAFLETAGILVPVLQGLDADLHELLVANNQYELTTSNLYSALGADPSGHEADLALDHVRKNEVVYEYCLSDPDGYLSAFDLDERTRFTIRTPETLASVLRDIAETWDLDQIGDLLDCAAPESSLPNLRDVPETTWQTLASSELFRPSLANVENYRKAIGSIDDGLAKILESADAVFTSQDEDVLNLSGEEIDAGNVAIAILNATTITDPNTRAGLARGLVDGTVPVVTINPDRGPLFSVLLERGLVADEHTSFVHFYSSGWVAIGPAIAKSEKIAEFLTADLVRGMVGDLLDDPVTSEKIGTQIVENIDEFVPDADHRALETAARYADKHGISLTSATVLRLAPASASNQRIVLRLLRNATVPPDAQEVAQVFTALGQPYSNITQSGAEFDVPHDDLHATHLSTLQAAGYCSFKKRRGRDRYIVSVT